MHGQRADAVTADAAAQLAAVLDVHGQSRRAQAEPAREERAATLQARQASRNIGAPADAPELEEIGIVQEEIALLGEEQAEAREVDLPIVDLGRGEVRVDRQRRVQRGVMR